MKSEEDFVKLQILHALFSYLAEKGCQFHLDGS